MPPRKPPPRKRAPGGGRKPIYDGPMEKCAVTLPAPLADKARNLDPAGNQNLSAGIRHALDHFVTPNKKPKK